jgi:hypothetical protein
MTHRTRALELLFQAIREVESREELGRLAGTARELYVGDDETLRTLMRAIEVRGDALAARLEQAEMFSVPPTEAPPEYRAGPTGPAPPDLVREWCEQVTTMGPDELSAFDELISAHWERASLLDVRHAIAQRRRELAG